MTLLWIIGYPEPPAEDKKLCAKLAQYREWRRNEPEVISESAVKNAYELTSLHTNGQSKSLDNLIQEGQQASPSVKIKDATVEIAKPRFGEHGELILNKFGDIPRRFCDLCLVNQPLRARHCYVCNQCVLRFDHHCPFIGVCIGQNTHLIFWFWLMWQSTTIAWAFALMVLSTVHVYTIPYKPIRSAWNISFAIPQLPAMVLSIVISFVLFACLMLVGSVMVFQSWMVISNQITYESIRKPGDISTWPWYFRYMTIGRFDPNGKPRPVVLPDGRPEVKCKSDSRPFDRGLIRNMADFFDLGFRTFKQCNRGWKERWNLNSPPVEEAHAELMARSKGKQKAIENPQEWEPRENGWIDELFINELDSRLIPEPFMSRLRREAGLDV